MSKPTQNIQDIAPMPEQNKTAKTTDPVQADYAEGKALLEKNELGLAAAALHNALVGFEEKNNLNGIANASNQLGTLCLQRQDYDKALQHFSRAEKICRELKDPLSLLALSKQFIVVYSKAGRYQDAIQRCLDVLDLYQANNNPKGTVEVMEKMAEVYLQSGDKPSAADTYRTIASIHKNFSHERIAAEFIEKAEGIDKGI